MLSPVPGWSFFLFIQIHYIISHTVDYNGCYMNKPPHLFPHNLLEVHSSQLISYSFWDVDKPTIWLETAVVECCFRCRIRCRTTRAVIAYLPRVETIPYSFFLGRWKKNVAGAGIRTADLPRRNPMGYLQTMARPFLFQSLFKWKIYNFL